MRFPSLAHPVPIDRIAIATTTFSEETALVEELARYARGDEEEGTRIESLADQLNTRLHTARLHAGGIDALLALYPLTSPEGRALLALAEALPRIPDNAVADQLIREKLGGSPWRKLDAQHANPALLSNIAARGLILAGSLSHHWASEPLVRATLRSSMDWLGRQFVLSETIYDALESSDPHLRYSYDMLGESAISEEDAARYYARYASAIHHVGLASRGLGPREGPGISVKLSALHARYSRQQRPRVRTELFTHLRELAISASEYNLNFTLDAEEADRLDLQLELFSELAHDPDLAGWDGLGIAVQAYQKRAFSVIEWLGQLATETGRSFMVRLVKGAYWDSEIKRAQIQGLPNYPVFTHKAHTDLSFLACMRRLFELSDRLYPQIATHNPLTAAAAHIMAGAQDFEFQYLYGMGEDLYKLTRQLGLQRSCRVYAPVGPRATLLPYLVRRILENGANNSFIHQAFSAQPIRMTAYPAVNHETAIPKPADLFAPRRNSAGLAWFDENTLAQLEAELAAITETPAFIEPIPDQAQKTRRSIFNPADPADLVGIAIESHAGDIESAIHASILAAPDWRAQDIHHRAAILERTAKLLEIHRGECIHLLVREAGKTLVDAHNELREAVDLCRYYAGEARQNWPDDVPAPLGIVLTISPWNFPLSIFIGQIAAALVTGNTVLAKPSDKTPLIAALATRYLLEAGVPAGVLQLLPGTGHIAAALIATRQCNGVLFTGSLDTARRIRRQLAEYEQSSLLVAETGGINAMIVDSSAHPEQTVTDIIASAFNSAGQRCSALRVLCIQEDIADTLLHQLKSAVSELRIADPAWLDCDVGPVIDGAALTRLHETISDFRKHGFTIWQAPFDEHSLPGYFLPPTLVEIHGLSDLPGEIFGPVLCILRYRAKKLPELLHDLASHGHGLTLGLQSRLNILTGAALATLPAGNYYVNRSQVGAVVESQPFGGHGLSGTGTKAGGPWYLWQLVRDVDACQTRHNSKSPLTRKLDEFARQWAIGEESARLIAHFEDYTRRSPLGQTRLLRGPTGEENTLSWRGRGTIACLGPSHFDLIHQIGAALITGNTVTLDDNDTTRHIAAALYDTPIQLTSNPLGQPDLDAVLLTGPSVHETNTQLAQRHGAIIPVIAPLCDGNYPLYRLVAEFTVTVNTTAAGGNIELLSRDL